MQTKTHSGVDYFRLFAAFLVVAIHIGPLSAINSDLDFLLTYCFGRVAVPFFLMVTGYFVLAPYVNSGFQKQRAPYKFFKKTAVLYCAVTCLYLPISWYAENLPTSFPGFLKWFFVDGSFYHLWYFPAVILGCLVLLPLIKKSVKLAFWCTFAAYCIGLLGDSFYGLIRGVPWLKTSYEAIFSVSDYTRNGIFFTPLFLLLGTLLANRKYRCNKKACQLGFAISLCLMLVEGALTYKFDLQRHNSMYLFLPATMYFLFQLLLKTQAKPPFWSRKLSSIIYCIHPAVIVLVRGACKAFDFTDTFVADPLIHFITVWVVSVLCSAIILFIYKRGRSLWSKQNGLGLK